MAEYKSAYTGPQIDAAIGAVSGKQDTLVSGTNIKTINNNSILGSGNLEISGGGGGANIKLIDVQDPTQWDSSNEEPTSAVIADVAAGDYLAVGPTNIPINPEEAPDLTASAFYIRAMQYDYDEYETHARFYYKFDEGDEEEGEPPFMEVLYFIQQHEDEEDPTSPLEYVFAKDEYPLGSSAGGGVYYVDINSPVSATRCTLDLEAITAAMDEDKEILIRFPAYSPETDYRFFTLATTEIKRYFQDLDEPVYTPTFTCKTIDREFTMVFDEYNNGEFYYNIVQGGKHMEPTSIDMANNEIAFDVDDYTYLWNFHPDIVTIDVDENSSELWIKFNYAFYDDSQQGEEKLYYTSDPIPVLDSGAITFQVMTLILEMNGGNIETSIYVTNLSEGAPV